ncbi:hypothetical protein PGT21_007967 [Puccinia graminis f. sp. tritici]|uniref:Uncharacterized protein n=1 Tax=Puccinia graminis f. sp. tritici TaxID=56615 RepID=A0A5B0SLJ2_PUCGR|nr:hypothetical protein PGT21_007967 [Puccinia graminis f. sp. tritici]KAA1138710.1 hypothetical protein PGTUg99_035264 [Puccinia graminis f. sp. tritici]
MFKSKALMLRVCAGTAITLLTLSVQLVVLEARHTSLVPRDGFVKNCVRFLGEHYDDNSKMSGFHISAVSATRQSDD